MASQQRALARRADDALGENVSGGIKQDQLPAPAQRRNVARIAHRSPADADHLASPAGRLRDRSTLELAEDLLAVVSEHRTHRLAGRMLDQVVGVDELSAEPRGDDA
ncbi:MAG TPA: hypothetical protein VML96_05220, partial [Egibacteraceae bacterium]|nr:hypothetical protein [Egibacteraceae bacterium]